jgi:putative ABC transport system ATP-binding protein
VSEPAIFCRALEKHYATASGTVRALDGLDLDVQPGEFLAVTGPSGCGKTTLLNLLGALDSPSGGEVRVFGTNLSGLGSRDRALYRRGSVGFVFQQFHLIPTLTALENVALPLHYAGVPRRERREQAAALLDRVGLASRRDHFPSLLSGGEQQRVALARSLVGGAKLLLADEPTGNLDGETARQIVGFLEEPRRRGVTVVMVTHDPEVAGMAGRRIRLRDGRLEGSDEVPPMGARGAP